MIKQPSIEEEKNPSEEITDSNTPSTCLTECLIGTLLHMVASPRNSWRRSEREKKKKEMG